MWNAILQLLALLFGLVPKTSAVDKAIQTANDTSRKSAEAARDTQANTEKDLTRVKNETNSDLERLDGANSLRERIEIARNAVKRANAEPGPHN